MFCRSRLLYQKRFRHKFLASTTASAISPYKLHINLNLPNSSIVFYHHSLNGDNRRSLFLCRWLVSGLSAESEACGGGGGGGGGETTARFVEMSVEGTRKGLKDYFEESKVMIKSDGGPPRWFSPLESGARSHDSPLLLFLPGIDGVGLGLVRHHYKLGKIFDICCLHIPVKDRTSFAGLIKLVEKTIRSEVKRLPNRPIYLVGESLGACIALAVASCNPDVDLVLILANPATSFSKSQLQSVLPLLEVIPDHFHLSLHYVLSSMTDQNAHANAVF